MHALRRLIHRAHRRWMWQVALVYAITAVVVVRAAQAIASGFGLPAWTAHAVALACVLGLPLALAITLLLRRPPNGPHEPRLRSSDLPYDTPPS
ncbi:MAG: hypothetical protein ACRELV_13685 [Longimicrobiales bacterium]